MNNMTVALGQMNGKQNQDLLQPWGSVIIMLAGLLLLAGCQGSIESVSKPKPTVAELAEPSTRISSGPESPSVSPVPSRTDSPTEKSSVKSPVELVTRGALVYQEHCRRCHGVTGQGNGELAADLDPRPTNLAAGVYKFRSTASGALPTDADLFRILSVGVPGTAMSDFQDLSVSQRQALVSYLKTLSSRFNDESPPSPVQFPENRTATDQDLDRGKQVYADMQCAACHGEQGKGDGELADALSDSSGVPIRPANLTKKPLKSGAGPEDIYRTVMTGLDGTPMPSYGDSLSPDQGQDLSLYVFSLSQRRGEK